jgi:hypothetical protein
VIRQLRLNTLPNTRKSYNRIIREYLRDELSTEKARTLAYLLNGVLQFWRLESDIRSEQKLDEVLDLLEEQKQEADRL